MAVLVQACREADFDAATQTCAAPVWVVQNGGLPELSIADAQQIAVAIATVWAVAFALRLVRRAIEEIGR